MQNNAKSTINKICAFLFAAILALMLIFNGINWYAESFASLKESIEENFTAFPIEVIDNGLKRIFGLYLRQTNRLVENGVITLVDGRRILEEHSASPSMFARADAIASIRDYLDTKDTPFMFVRVPTAIRDKTQLPMVLRDTVTILEDVELFMERLREHDVEVLDLHAQMIQDDMDFAEIFYHGDHHWNAFGALYAYGQIAGFMNSAYGFNIDEKTWDINEYDVMTYQDAYIGYISGRLDNASEDTYALLPRFDTYIEAKSLNPFNPDEHMQTLASGTYQEVFVPRAYESNIEYMDYWEDMYSLPPVFNRFTNTLAGEDKKILLLADSFGASLTYFTTGLTTFDYLNLSVNNSPLMYPMLAEEQYDMVIFMLWDGFILSEFADLHAGRFNFGEPLD